MKNLKTLLLIAVIALGFNNVQAQSKVAHINLQELISLMPETKVMKTTLEKLEKTNIDDLKAEDAILQAKYKKFQTELANQTKEENEKRQLEIEQGKRKLQAGAQAAQNDLNIKNNELVQPIIEKADKAVKAVAKAQGFDYVLDSSVLLVANGTNLLSLVKAHLGIQ
ncbi:MAG: hypothetical protein COA67_09115 [Lutibacter sp.]|nr:MAG: hypothetical protein COA67_09115 [Lutibacter sp.]